MKKYSKFMFLALFAIFGFNKAMAADPAVGDLLSDNDYKYRVSNILKNTQTEHIAEVVIYELNDEATGNITITGNFTKKYDGVTWTFNVVRIGNNVFKDQTELTGVTFPVELQYINQYAFVGCTLLKDITFPVGSKLRRVYTKAFATTQIETADFRNCDQMEMLDDYVFAEGGSNMNSFVKTVYLPTTTMFTSFGKALANLPNLATTNIDQTKVTSISAKAFNNDAQLKTMVLPGTVETIYSQAFEGSSVANLTIDLTSIETIQAGVYGNNNGDNSVLTTLTFTNPLKGTIAAGAFEDQDKLAGTLDMHSVNLGTTASIEGRAFTGKLIEKVWLGDIANNATGDYTIKSNAFSGAKLAEVEIGSITTNMAIASDAFDNGTKYTLKKVTIGNIITASDPNGYPINDGAFQYGDFSEIFLTIGNVNSIDATNPVMAPGAFVTNHNTAANPKFKIVIGDVISKGNAFSIGSIDNSDYATTIQFGNIEKSGLNVPVLEDNSELADCKFTDDVATTPGVKFAGTVAAGGICTGAFDGIDPVFVPKAGTVEAHASLSLIFVGEMAPGAVQEGAFLMASAPLGDADKLPVLLVDYQSTTHSNTYLAGMPFSKKAFWNTWVTGAKRDIKVQIANATLYQTFLDNQYDGASDVLYRAMVELPAAQNFIAVYNDNNNDGTSYARIFLPAGTKIKIDRRPVGKDIEGVDQTGITYNLFTVYKEEDVDSKVTNLNMLPMVCNDGFYYVDATDDMLLIVKATGTKAEDDNITKMWYEEVGNIPADKKSNKYDGDGCVKVATQVVTNEQLNDGSGNTGVEALTSTKLEANNVYLLTDPSKFYGLKAVVLDYENYAAPFINIGNFYALGKKYDAAPARMIINWYGESEATAIVAAKTANVKDGAIYTLQGVRVSAPVKGGVYIQNGKKFIVK